MMKTKILAEELNVLDDSSAGDALSAELREAYIEVDLIHSIKAYLDEYPGYDREGFILTMTSYAEEVFDTQGDPEAEKGLPF